MLGEKDELSDPFATDEEDEALYADVDAADDPTADPGDGGDGLGSSISNQQPRGGDDTDTPSRESAADAAVREKASFRPMFDTRRRWADGDAYDAAVARGDIVPGEDAGAEEVHFSYGALGDVGAGVGDSAAGGVDAASADAGGLGWSTIGGPGFQYERESDRTGAGAAATLGKRGAAKVINGAGFVPPVTVEYTRIGTPVYSFDRHAGTACPLSRIVDALVARMRDLEGALDDGVDPLDVEPHVAELEGEITRSEPALARTAKGRVHFIKLKGFVLEMRAMLRAFEEDPAYEDRNSEASTQLISRSLMRSEKMRAVTSGLSGKGHIEASRSFKFYDDTAYE